MTSGIEPVVNGVHSKHTLPHDAPQEAEPVAWAHLEDGTLSLSVSGIGEIDIYADGRAAWVINGVSGKASAQPVPAPAPAVQVDGEAVHRAANAAREVFAESCSDTFYAIDYMEHHLLADLRAATAPTQMGAKDETIIINT